MRPLLYWALPSFFLILFSSDPSSSAGQGRSSGVGRDIRSGILKWGPCLRRTKFARGFLQNDNCTLLHKVNRLYKQSTYKQSFRFHGCYIQLLRHLHYHTCYNETKRTFRSSTVFNPQQVSHSSQFTTTFFRIHSSTKHN
jgi:hypothetical protein